METMLFRSDKKRIKPIQTKSLKDLTSILAPALLLADGKRQELLLKITKSSGFEASRFDNFCLSLIYRVANYCQNLPETSNSYYSQPGGLLDHALNRTQAALQIFRQFIAQGEEGELSEEQKLWLYALFSAAMLQGIGKLQVDYCLHLFDSNGQLIKQWQPLLETMDGMGNYYNYEFQKNNDDDLRRRLNLLLARQIMPANGFAWITSNPQVLAIWLALLDEDSGSMTTLRAILERADAIAIQNSWNDLINNNPHGRLGRGGRIGTFIDATPDYSPAQERLIAADFIRWVADALAKGLFVMNQPPFALVAGGMLMTPEVFKFFARHHHEYKNWLAVQKGFLSLGIHVKGADGNALSRVQHKNETLEGILVEKYEMLLPEQLQVKNSHTNEVTTVKSIELTHQQGGAVLHQLSLQGQWQPMPEAPAVHMRMGNKLGG